MKIGDMWAMKPLCFGEKFNQHFKCTECSVRNICYIQTQINKLEIPECMGLFGTRTQLNYCSEQCEYREACKQILKTHKSLENRKKLREVLDKKPISKRQMPF